MKTGFAELANGVADLPARTSGSSLSALGALFVLTLRQQLRGRRFLLLCLLFLIPGGLALLFKSLPHAPNPGHVEFVLVFNLIPHALATLTALLYAAGIIQDEVEDQTLTYLLLRPLPRWALYLTKLAATVCVTSLLTAVFTLLVYAILYWDTGEFGNVLGGRALQTVALLALAQAAYCSLFAALSLFTQRILMVGLAYIILLEALLANFDIVLRRLTVMYYFRVLVVRWIEPPDARAWSLNLNTIVSAGTCVEALLGVTIVGAILGALLMGRREFLMKTPGGN